MLDAAYVSVCQMAPVLSWLFVLVLFVLVPAVTIMWALDSFTPVDVNSEIAGFIVCVPAIICGAFFIVWSFHYYGWAI
jgi:hypothetical protein